jgi:Protein of unknown function (DUF3106)
MLCRVQIAALSLACASALAADQKNAAAKKPPAPRAEWSGPNSGSRNSGGGGRRIGPGLTNPSNPVTRLFRASPEERDRALEKLPAKMQEQFRARLQWFDNLPPVQQQLVLNRTERFAALPPERQQAIKSQFQALNKLPQDRRGAIGQVLRRFEVMPDDQRAKMLASDEFKSRFDPEEQKIIADLSEVMLPPQ